jgi:hypothetical protein
MISITVNDNNRTYTGETWDEVLVKLHKDQLVPEKTELRYMRAVARRTKMWNHSLIRTDSAENFFADLCLQGLIHINIVH